VQKVFLMDPCIIKWEIRFSPLETPVVDEDHFPPPGKGEKKLGFAMQPTRVNSDDWLHGPAELT